MRKLIINADDLGYGEIVNTEIEKCINNGVITSATLMANAPGFNEGVRIAKSHPDISVGVHLNLVEFSPLTNIDVFRKYGLVDDEGNFREGAIFVTTITDELEQAIYEEWNAQILRVTSAGITPSHIDSHQHTHTILALKKVLCRLLDEHSIKRVRCKSIPSIRLMLFGKNNITVNLDKSKAVNAKKRNVIYRRFHLFTVKIESYMWNKTMKNRFHMTYAYYALRTFFENRSLIDLGGADSTIEIMCHPGHNAFKLENDILKKLRAWLPNDYQLINYYNI